MLTAKTGKQANYRSNLNGDRGWGTRTQLQQPQPQEAGYDAQSSHRKGRGHGHSKRSEGGREMPVSHDVTSGVI